ncbi:hypothetical protein [Xanthomonas rydalmerensis]|uniref:Uncharacterized protein n=1 Tax=Xanthomonas rydalmerensis TaxID=3046274 RepID=A0ABZ0JTF5_9XANT|nr:hypothetical protein [Xanthomonas sp. DM-2023]WOS42284.1 hypothetical protein QN243_07550 [Xanthomonas sp. DM-2023]WOS46471.1 hypothetical protein QN242_07550 [Xanthomonas sp. DM-2023]WOS50650.1 hypothetical protein QN240_07550 [Xanthomonas sp. DM-2023]WOS54830.1 hypothetical protein QN244_07550 [Xanthomonas sp. DM-2023]WOS59013.1 hypothetical protein QN245_07550 [Xanthomonas sp. DM-2023]
MSHAPAPATPLQLLRWILDDDLDAAIDGGLMEYRGTDPGDDGLDPAHPHLRAQVLAAQQRLREAWAARARYRARTARLERLANARQARRAATIPVASTSAATTAAPSAPALPAAAAAILARAKAKAAQRGGR